MLVLKVTAVGASDGLILTEEAKRFLNVQEGDALCLTEAPGGAMRVTRYNPEFGRQMTLAESIMLQDQEILRVLAK
jgi:putative addiction module antidote